MYLSYLYGIALFYRVVSGIQLFQLLSDGNPEEASSTKRLYVFGQNRVQFNGRKGCSSKRLEKKGTPLGLGPRKDTAVNVCRAELKMWRISFFGPKP